METSDIRVAWLLPSMARGLYFHVVFRAYTGIFPETLVLTGLWPGYAAGCEDSFKVEVVGRTRFLRLDPWKKAPGYGRIICLPPLAGITRLVEFGPQVVFTSGYNLWTAFALALKPWKRWRVIIIYDGSSPSVDFRSVRTRLMARRMMTRRADGFLTNSKAGQRYLTKVLGAPQDRVFARPYMVPNTESLLSRKSPGHELLAQLRRPIFLSVGRIIPEKGLGELLEACATLKAEGDGRFSLVIVGDGSQRTELEHVAKRRGLDGLVRWAGWVDYGELGFYFEQADVFVFPTLEDVWGMVALEAMAFGKPVICSSLAGAAEMVVDGSNGWIVDPRRPAELAQAMRRFIVQPNLISSMGQKSRELMAAHTSKAVTSHLVAITRFAMGLGPSVSKGN